MAPRLLEPLRPKPFRGDVVAAGVVVLVTLVGTLATRFDEAWGPDIHLAYAALAWAFVTTMAVLAPMEGAAPRAYQSILYVASFALALATLSHLADVLGAAGVLRSSGSVTWIAALLVLHAAWFAVRRNSAVCTLLGAVTAAIALVAAVVWLFDPSSAAPLRWVLLALVAVYGLCAVGLRDRRLRHGVALVDAAGFAALAIGLSFATSEHHAGWGWELLILGAGFGLIAYSSVDRQPGPAWIGVANLVVFTAMTSLGVGATLLGWPLFLIVAAAFLLAVGLRPTHPAPPPPDVDAPPAPTLPLR